MKLTRSFHLVLLLSALTMYATGSTVFVLSNWFFVDGGLGPEPSPTRALVRDLHGIAGLWFLSVFGYLFHAHVRPSWRRGLRLPSGTTITAATILLMLTVPILLYSANKTLEHYAGAVHTYLGLATVFVFVWHRRSR